LCIYNRILPFDLFPGVVLGPTYGVGEAGTFAGYIASGGLFVERVEFEQGVIIRLLG